MKKFLFAILALTLFFSFASSSDAATLSKPSNNLGLVGYWSFNDATSTASVGTKATDFSGRGNTGTLTNGPTWVDGKLGKALNFDGSNDYVTIPDNDVLDMTGDFTYSIWHKLASTPAQYTTLFSKGQNAVNVGFDTTGYFAGGSFVGFGFSTKGSYTVGVWEHVVVTRSGDTWSLYKNGVEVTPGVSAAISISNTVTAQAIGYDNSTGSRYFPGILDEARIYSRALSATEVIALYNSGAGKFAQASKTGLLAHWTFDDATSTKATDFSGNGHTGTLTNMDATTDWVNGKRMKALDFDGTNDYVELGIDRFSDAQVGSSGTIAGWFKLASLPSSGNEMTILDIEGYTGSQIINSSGNTRVQVRIYDGAVKTAIGTTNLEVGRWYHYAETWNGSTARVFLNGVEENSVAAGSMNPSAFTRTNTIGQNCDACGGTTKFNGVIDDLRIYSRALSTVEVAALASSGVQSINASQNRTGSSLDTGLVGLWSFNGQDISGTTAYDRSGQGNNGTLTNSPTRTIGKVGQALTFNGSTNYVKSSASVSISGNADVTLSVWAKFPSLASDNQPRAIAGLHGSNVDGFILGSAWDGQGSVFVGFYNGLRCYTAASEVSVNQWYHIVATKSAGAIGSANTHIYIDGVDKSLTCNTSGTPNFINDMKMIVGYDDFEYSEVNAVFDEYRVYNRALSASEVKQLYNLGK